MSILLPILLCLSLEAGAPPPVVIAPPAPTVDELEELKRSLRSDDERDRRKAVIGLVELGSGAAWELVLGALEDRSPVVADEAQLRFAAAPASLLPVLLGKEGIASKREYVSLRVAELLGRVEDPGPSKEWAALLRNKDADVRRSLLWSIERQALAGGFGEGDEKLIEAVAKLTDKDKVEEVRAQALLALAALSAESALPRLAQARRGESAALRAAAAERNDLLPVSERLLCANVAAMDEAPLVRLRGYETLAARADRDGALALVDGLARETELRLSWRVTELLQDLSGMKYGRDPESWRRWARALENDWRSSEQKSQREYGERTAAFVGMPILSGRIAFLIDFSGSMWEERDGKTRKEVVDVELRRALEGLPETTEFNLHPYTGEPMRWRKKLVPAKRGNVQRALDYFEGNQAYGKGDFWGAAWMALEDPRVDTLMVLTDGAPSGGYRWNLTLMKALFAHENRFRGVFLDVLLVDTKEFLQRHWETMCETSGGRCLAVDL